MITWVWPTHLLCFLFYYIRLWKNGLGLFFLKKWEETGSIEVNDRTSVAFQNSTSLFAILARIPTESSLCKCQFNACGMCWILKFQSSQVIKTHRVSPFLSQTWKIDISAIWVWPGYIMAWDKFQKTGARISCESKGEVGWLGWFMQVCHC